MTGLEKIVAQIKEEAEASSRQALAQARAEANALYAEGKAEAEKQRAELKARTDAEVELALSRGRSAAKLQERKMLLLAKQQIIGEVIETAKQELNALSADEYFDFILKLVARNARLQAGEILFSEKDLKRLPSDFSEKLKSYSLTVSGETRRLEGGFILLYDGIEENCSFDALFAEKRETLQDKVCRLLFE